jgi:hypothetical protein
MSECVRVKLTVSEDHDLAWIHLGPQRGGVIDRVHRNLIGGRKRLVLGVRPDNAVLIIEVQAAPDVVAAGHLGLAVPSRPAPDDRAHVERVGLEDLPHLDELPRFETERLPLVRLGIEDVGPLFAPTDEPFRLLAVLGLELPLDGETFVPQTFEHGVGDGCAFRFCLPLRHCDALPGSILLRHNAPNAVSRGQGRLSMPPCAPDAPYRVYEAASPAAASFSW